MTKKSLKTYQTPTTMVFVVRIENTLLTGSTDVASSADFEDLSDGGDFAW